MSGETWLLLILEMYIVYISVNPEKLEDISMIAKNVLLLLNTGRKKQSNMKAGNDFF